MSKINVCVACDDNYAKYAGVVIASVIQSSSNDDDLAFYILDGGIKEENKSKINELKKLKKSDINFVSIDNSQFSDYLAVKTHDYISLPTYYRLKLPTLLPDVKKIIYFDCDMIINHSLKQLFELDMGESAVMGVKDLNKKVTRKNPTYVNAGMLVFDLENMKKQNLEQEFLNWTIKNKDTIKLGDQEIINEVLKGKIKIANDRWNVQSSNFTNRSSYTHYPYVIHFVARKKPWHFGSFSYHKDLYFKYLQFTPWALKEEKEIKYWLKDNKIASLFGYIKYRPLFALRPRFYKALFLTYIGKFFEKEEI